MNTERINEIFREIHLEENYNFLAEDLVLMANAFVRYAEPMIRKDELDACVGIVSNLNRVVGEKLQEVRNVDH